MSRPKETELYPPVKAFLKKQGYDVKSEIGAVDVMGIRGDDEPVIVELKTGFSLSLFHQAIDRKKLVDNVYICVPRGTGRVFAKTLKDNTGLCRRLGIGLLSVRLRDGFIEAHCDPGPYRPVKSARRKGRLLREFQRRMGDPNNGGQTRVGLVTAYRQDALKCAGYLVEHGPTKGSVVAEETGVPTATRIMAADHYGWFERVNRGVYGLTPRGQTGVQQYADPIGVDQ